MLQIQQDQQQQQQHHQQQLQAVKFLTNTLVFKLSSVFQEYFPALGSTGLKLITLWMYISYALIGDIICLNILLFVSYNLINRFMGYKLVFSRT